jgi:PAS domain S-box-containing protein
MMPAIHKPETLSGSPQSSSTDATITVPLAEYTALKRNELLLHDCLESSVIGMHWTAPDGTVLWANQADLDLLGYAQEEYIGRNIAQFHADRRVARDILARVALGESVRDYPVSLRHRDGSLRHVLITSDRYLEGGEFAYARTLTRDVTKLQSQEHARWLLGAIVDSSEDAIISKDLNGVITSWNKSAERVFGYTAEEAVGRTVAELLIPADRQEEEPRILERLHRGERVEHFETLRKRRDGKLLNISLTISPVKDAQGRVIGASKIARDISEPKAAEAALRASEERFRQLAEVGPQIVWLGRPNGELEFVNQRWTDYSGLDLATTNDPETVAHHLHPEDKVPEHWMRSVSTGTPFELEARLRGQSGDFRWFLIRSVPVKDEQGRVVRWFGTSTDIHENKTMQLQLQRANADLEQFAYSASHDLQEPLRTMKIYAELLSLRYAGEIDGEAGQFLHFLTRAAARMESLVRDLLVYTQLSKSELSSEETDAQAVLSATLADLEGAIRDSSATVTQGDLPRVRMHRLHMKQLLQNLIGNAIKYRADDRRPVIHVSAEKEKDSWIFTVRDNGIGIEPEYNEQIFGLFRRLHNSDRYSGTGIGLAICQRIVERYHGRIWVESEPGVGSSFRFAVPV